jgi:4-diphosphocytidyl-2-C-methyl-D-erythritol kinase
MEKMPEGACTIDAPCKINLHLCIGDKRPDGFHNLQSLFACLAFFDTLRFLPSGKKGECLLSIDLEQSTGGENILLIPPEDNLVYRAVSLFRERTGFSDGLEVLLKKRIPAGAGLGGGSSDAASTLLALNRLAGNRASMEELMDMAAILGSDVPFFLTGGLALVGGRGELIEPVVIAETSFFTELTVVLVKPPFSSDTATAYKHLDLSRIEATACGAKFPKEDLIRSLEEDPLTWPFYNDFLSIDSAGVYRAILEDLRKTGASFASLSGTGSCCFGIYTVKKTAEKAVKYLAGRGNFVRLTFFLANKANPVVK